jgi:hypothetical protein
MTSILRERNIEKHRNCTGQHGCFCDCMTDLEAEVSNIRNFGQLHGLKMKPRDADKRFNAAWIIFLDSLQDKSLALWFENKKKEGKYNMMKLFDKLYDKIHEQIMLEKERMVGFEQLMRDKDMWENCYRKAPQEAVRGEREQSTVTVEQVACSMVMLRECTQLDDQRRNLAARMLDMVEFFEGKSLYEALQREREVFHATCVCVVCERTAAQEGLKRLPRCSACTIELAYCSAECQRAHWQAHRAECMANRIPTVPSGAANSAWSSPSR